MRHEPVLLNEVVRVLDPKPGEFVIDGTADGGGHALALLERVLPDGKLLALDLDGEMLAAGKRRIAESLDWTERDLAKRAVFLQGNYADLPEMLSGRQLPKADCLLLDLGFSSEQLEHSGRGFSFLRDEPLLMTYAAGEEPVSSLLSRMREDELAKVIFEFGGERFARRIAKAIKETGRKKRIETTGDLKRVILGAVPRGYERGRIDPATRTFQALRIHANHEFENLERILGSLGEVLAPRGRAAVITFHSLEDRIVKNRFRELARDGKGELLLKKPLGPERAEVLANPRSRSAKLRAIRMAASEQLSTIPNKRKEF